MNCIQSRILRVVIETVRNYGEKNPVTFEETPWNQVLDIHLVNRQGNKISMSVIKDGYCCNFDANGKGIKYESGDFLTNDPEEAILHFIAQL